jgi:hypothetical protein
MERARAKLLGSDLGICGERVLGRGRRGEERGRWIRFRVELLCLAGPVGLDWIRRPGQIIFSGQTIYDYDHGLIHTPSVLKYDVLAEIHILKQRE